MDSHHLFGFIDVLFFVGIAAVVLAATWLAWGLFQPLSSGPQNKENPETGTLRQIIYFTVLGLLMSIVIELIYVALYNDPEHAARMLNREVGYLHDDFRDAADTVIRWQAVAYYYTFVAIGLDAALVWTGDFFGVTDYIYAGLNTIKLFFVRVLILGFSLVSFAFFAVAGLAAGWAMRELRRHGGGIERGGIYHIAKKRLPQALAIAWVVYLSAPVSIHPNYVVLPGAALTGAVIMIIVSTYKKHL